MQAIQKYTDGLGLLAITAWAGGLWGVGYLAVPVLFGSLQDRMLAGAVAGKMFTAVAYVGIVCAVYLLAYRLALYRKAALRQSVFIIVAIMLALTLIGLCGIQPAIAEIKAQVAPGSVADSPLAGRFGMLHGMASMIYLLQSLLAAVLVVRARNS
ncbi:MAG: DUF4149 domain-containing protein [Gallionellaceae bacterium]|jgi:hypothetical protein|nr:DUF4149 domain-containing protein [Gallionellaceae bacterium]